VLVAGVPELGELSKLKMMAPRPRVVRRDGELQVLMHVWDWATDGKSYGLEVVTMARVGQSWQVRNSVLTRHAVLAASQVGGWLTEAGFQSVQRLEPSRTRHPVPIWVAK
jgi:hypothetical protein